MLHDFLLDIEFADLTSVGMSYKSLCNDLARQNWYPGNQIHHQEPRLEMLMSLLLWQLIPIGKSIAMFPGLEEDLDGNVIA